MGKNKISNEETIEKLAIKELIRISSTVQKQVEVLKQCGNLSKKDVLRLKKAFVKANSLVDSLEGVER